MQRPPAMSENVEISRSPSNNAGGSGFGKASGNRILRKQQVKTKVSARWDRVLEQLTDIQ